MPATLEDQPSGEDASPEGDAATGDGDFAVVGFSYGGGEGVADALEPGSEADGEGYDPGFPVPSHLSPLLRGVTDRSHKVQIMPLSST